MSVKADEATVIKAGLIELQTEISKNQKVLNEELASNLVNVQDEFFVSSQKIQAAIDEARREVNEKKSSCVIM